MRRTSSCRVPRVSASSAEKGSSMSRILGSIDERAGDADALLHAAGQLRRALVLGARKPDERDEAARPRLDLVRGAALRQREATA